MKKDGECDELGVGGFLAGDGEGELVGLENAGKKGAVGVVLELVGGETLCASE